MTNQRFSKKAILGQLQIQLDNAKNAEPGTEHPGKVEALVCVKAALEDLSFNKSSLKVYAIQRINEINNTWRFYPLNGCAQVADTTSQKQRAYWEMYVYRGILDRWY